ncbi:DUF885 family protein [Sphingomonas sp. M1-B02]|uniref:DUF885 family protein n=1 Tax=Sphingomonas sp. M1-B02 TaxID=3114300 RepID=UPI00223EEC69|nr:DUF885 family protein [Sphingomonas sp. S6-11]UZK66344.1 DUF885 family protein [Sphingomonas sp. S6-11]
MSLLRRDMLRGMSAAAVAAAAPAFARTSADDALKIALDSLGALPDYPQRLARLAAFDTAALSSSARIDLLTVVRALEIDARLADLVPGGKRDGPYRLPAGAAPGDEAYALLLERHIGAPSDPGTAHGRLAREAARLTARADRLMRSLGHGRGTVGTRYKALFADRRHHYPDSDSGRDALVADMNRWLDAGRAQVGALVGPLLPPSSDVSVRRMTRTEEAEGKSGYRRMPAAGASGAYLVDLKRIADRPRWSLESVVHHETLPGHMVQLPIETAAGAHPLRIAYLPVFSEGWAVHAEQMMADHGTYRGNPLGELGHIHWLLFRVVRGLVDVGIHHRRWSLAAARGQLDMLQGVPAYFAGFESDLDRIARDPAVRAAEALLWLGLADFTRGRRGASLRLANRGILEHGRKPLRLLDRNFVGAA